MTSKTKAQAGVGVGVGSDFFGLICGGVAHVLGYEYLSAGIGLLSVCIFGLIGGVIISKTFK